MKFITTIILFLSLNAHSQYADEFCNFPDTLEYLKLQEVPCGRIDWSRRHDQFSICSKREMSSWEFTDPIWVSGDSTTLVFGYYDGYSGVDIVHIQGSDQYIHWVVLIDILDTADFSVSQPDPLNHPELIQLNYSYTFGGGQGIIEERHTEIWNVNTRERVARYTTDYYMSGHGVSIDDRIVNNSLQEYSRTVEYIDGHLKFSSSEQIIFSSQEDKVDPENSFETQDTSNCAFQEYTYESNRFIKIKR